MQESTFETFVTFITQDVKKYQKRPNLESKHSFTSFWPWIFFSFGIEWPTVVGLYVCFAKESNQTKMAIANEDLEAVVKNLLNQSKEEQNKEWRSMVEEMVDAKLTQVEQNWKKTAAEKAKDSKIEIDVEAVNH